MYTYTYTYTHGLELLNILYVPGKKNVAESCCCCCCCCFIMKTSDKNKV